MQSQIHHQSRNEEHHLPEYGLERIIDKEVEETPNKDEEDDLME